MKISASIYSDKVNDVSTTIQNLNDNHVDMIHVDCKDDLNVFADIEIMQNRKGLLLGRDNQLEAAIAHILKNSVK